LTEKEKENLSDLARRGTFIEALRIPITDYFAAISFSQIGIEEVSQAILTLIIEAFTEEEKSKKSRDYVLYLIACNPEFRKDMYSLIGFTVTGTDYKLPASAFEYHISNHDVEHHDSYATFIIDGKEVDCFTDFITTKHYDEAKSDFFSVSTTALVPIDGTDIYYTPEQASNFDDVFGTNTDYVVDPEECLADNFSLAVTYGMKGPNGTGYPNPEIIQGIIDYLKR
jgi:hypothetical protein